MSPRSRAGGDAGFTLMEMIVAATLTVVIFGAVLNVTSIFQHQASANERRGAAQDEARGAVDQMAWLLRDAVTATPGSAAAIERSTDYDLIFQANDPANPASKIHVRYCVDASTPTEHLVKQTAPSTAALPSTACPDTATSGWTTANSSVVAADLVNRVITPTAVPAWSYDVAGSTIVAVDVRLAVDTDPNQQPGPVHLRTRVALRNVNRPPVAAVSCQLSANRHVICDASSSSDPEGEQLSYAWQYGSPPVSSGVTSYRLDQVMSPGTYTFTVTVTDPGGLTSSATSAPVTVT